MASKASLTLIQVNDSHAYFDLHKEIFWQGGPAVHRPVGGYVKRCLGLNTYFKIENPARHRIQKLFIGNEDVNPEQYYTAAFVTMQGVPQKFGRNRENRSERIIDAMQAYLIKHRPLHAELRGTFTAV